MYKVGAEVIQEGFGSFAKIILGTVSAAFGVMMIFIAPPTDKAIFFYLFAGFCLAISLACVFKGRLRQFIGSCIGTSVFILSLIYLVTQLLDGPFVSGSKSEPSVVNAMLFIIMFGLPSLFYVLKAKFGFIDRNVQKQK